MRKFRKNHHAEAGFLAAIIMVIGVMIAVIISAMIFYPFADAGQSVVERSEEIAIANVAVISHFNVSNTPDSTPEWSITANNAATAVPAANRTISGTWVQIDANYWGAGNTTATLEYNSLGHSSVGDVITYALIVFAMMAIVPLIIVGGLMLRSLGFFGGGGSGSGKP